ncbi:MAG: FtsQ-type POTRA domain-containing protein [Chloroflexi bacterium]|nr:FtsQ-type POTRA domain-containing protein [Chloroflexota bacterium]
MGVGVGLAAGIGAAAYGLTWLLLGDSLRVREVHISGRQIADPHEVAAAAALDGKSLLALDAAAAARRVEALAEVKAASVHRRWPRGVEIRLVEPQAWGYWQAAGRRVVIDERGEILERARAPHAGAPTIIEIGGPSEFPGGYVSDPDSVRLVARLVDDDTFARLKVRPTGFVFRRDRGLTVLVEGGPDVVFGDSTNYGFKVATWGALLRELAREPRVAREIDLRFGQRAVMR